MQDAVIRAACAGDFEAICALNSAEVTQTSAMDLARLTELDQLSCYHKVAILGGEVSAFLLAICNGAAYPNDNFEWFTQEHARFIYIDRIVVAPAARRKRLGYLLYEDLFGYARSHAIPFVACEYNIVPPNPASRSFHEKWGFEQVGTQWVQNHSKCVSLQLARSTIASRRESSR